MNWIFWVLLLIGLALIFSPFFAIVEATISAVLWLIGGMLLVAAIIWAVFSVSRAAPPTTAPRA